MRKEKQFLLDESKRNIESHEAFVVVRYLSLTANQANQFRREIAKSGGGYEVVRKRVLVKAAEAAGVTLDLEALTGHIGLVFTGLDPIETTKSVFQFAAQSNNAIEIIGGRFDGQQYGAPEVELLSKLPGKDEMRAQLLGTLEAPMAQTLAVMDAILASVVYCLDNKCQQETTEN